MNMLGGMSADQHFVDPLEDLPRRVEALGGGAQHGAGRRHHYRGGHALVGHVTDDEPQAAVLQLEEVVEVAAHLAGRLVVGRHVVPRQVRHAFGRRVCWIRRATLSSCSMRSRSLASCCCWRTSWATRTAGAVWVARSLRSLRSSAEYSCWLRRGPRLRSPISSPGSLAGPGA